MRKRICCWKSCDLIGNIHIIIIIIINRSVQYEAIYSLDIVITIIIIGVPSQNRNQDEIPFFPCPQTELRKYNIVVYHVTKIHILKFN